MSPSNTRPIDSQEANLVLLRKFIVSKGLIAAPKLPAAPQQSRRCSFGSVSRVSERAPGVSNVRVSDTDRLVATNTGIQRKYKASVKSDITSFYNGPLEVSIPSVICIKMLPTSALCEPARRYLEPLAFARAPGCTRSILTASLQMVAGGGTDL